MFKPEILVGTRQRGWALCLAVLLKGAAEGTSGGSGGCWPCRWAQWPPAASPGAV